MPYITQEQREDILQWVEGFSKFGIFELGELNYIITKILLGTNPDSYSDYNALIGLLECCKLEFYRKAVSKYEDSKRDDNGEGY